MADPESAAELSIVETPSYALAIVLLFFLTITFVADFVHTSNRRFLERRSKKGLLVSLFKWLGVGAPSSQAWINERPAELPAVPAVGTKHQDVPRWFWHRELACLTLASSVSSVVTDPKSS